MLCYRCEHRAEFLCNKGKRRPRHECGVIDTSKYSCYMYQPVKPVILKRDIDKQFRRPKIYDYFVSKYPGSRIRQEEEDSVIDRIYELYRIYP